MGHPQHVVLLLVTLSLEFGQVSPDIFSSTTALENFANGQDIVLSALDDYISREEERLVRLKRNAGIISQSSSQYDLYDKTDLEFASHPINAYQIIEMWNDVTSDIRVKPDSNVKDFLSWVAAAGLPFPDASDLEGAAEGVIRLQHTYKLSVEDLSRGVISGHRAGAPLDADDYYRLGLSALKSNDAGLAAQWLRGAVESHDHTMSFGLSEALATLSSAYVVAGRPDEAATMSSMSNELGGLSCSPPNGQGDMPLSCRLLHKDGLYIPDDELASYEKPETVSMKDHAALCRDNVTRDPSVVSRLFCVYTSGEIPYIRYKEEIHNLDPKIVFFHDVISNREATLLKNAATSQLARAMVKGQVEDSVVSNQRVSKVAWLWDEDPVNAILASRVKRLTERIGFITGLDTTHRLKLSSSEALQVSNYGIGGQYYPHHDYFAFQEWLDALPDNLMHTGDRIATFMLYLSQPVAGGATVFPQVDVKVPAIKNGAAFWYNMKRSGAKDPLTEHAGCPVLLGQKWVANKWIREFGQEFRRRCGLTEESTDYT